MPRRLPGISGSLRICSIAGRMKRSSGRRRKTRWRRYPFLRRNWVNTLLVPGSLGFALALWGLSPANEQADNFRQLIPLISLILFLPLLGYGWRLIHILRESGYDATAPDWTLENIIGSWWDGMKITLLISLAVLVIALPEFLLASITKGNSSETGSYKSHQKAIIYQQQGDACCLNGRYKEAIEYYSKAINLDPCTNTFGHPYKGDVSLELLEVIDSAKAYTIKQRLEEAVEYYSKAISINPNNAMVYCARGDIYFNQHRLDMQEGLQNAVEDYSKAIGLDPYNFWAYLRRGAAFLFQSAV